MLISGPLKHTIRSKATRTYLSADGKWVSDCRLAQDFQTPAVAISEVRKLKLRDVELVLLMGQQGSEYDVVLPMLPSELYDRT